MTLQATSAPIARPSADLPLADMLRAAVLALGALGLGVVAAAEFVRSR